MARPGASFGPAAECVKGHTAYVYDRGGRRRLYALERPSYVEWNRVRDDVSTARVRIESSNCARQTDRLELIRSHRHELVIFRGAERVWEGPIHRIAWHRDYVEIVANDVLDYIFHQPLTKKWSNAYPNAGLVSTRIAEIIEYEMTHGRQQLADGVTVNVPAWESMNPPANVVPNLVVHNFPNEARTTAVTWPYEMAVGEHLASLARYSGIDYCTVGRAIHIWDTSRALGRTQQMTEENFLDEIIVTEYGSDHAQAAYVLGQGQDGQGAPAYGQALATANLDYYGPWTTMFTPYTEAGAAAPTQTELNSQAIRNLAGRTPAPVEVRIPDNSGIILGDSFPLRMLVPGVQVPLRATLSARQYSQMQKIDSVRVTETADEGERISLTLLPTSRPDADDELPPDSHRVTVNFSGDPSYRLTAIATRDGASYSVRGVVEQLGGADVSGVGLPWSIEMQRAPGLNTVVNGKWDFDFSHYQIKTAAVAQVDSAALGLRTFSVTVSMGGSVGSATATGTVEV